MASTPRPTRFRTRMLGATVAAGALLGSMIVAPVANAAVTFVSDPASYVDTFSGTGDGGVVVGSINNFPGAAAPFGMIQFSPSNGDNGTGYRNGNTKLQGFATNFASQGCTAFGNFPVLPTTIDPTANQPWNRGSTIVTGSEHGEPGYYKTDTKDNTGALIGAELTATDRTGVAVFTFPSGTTPSVMVRSGRMNGKDAAKSALNVNPNNGTISGWAVSKGFCGATPDNQFKVYFTAKFEQPFSKYGAWNEDANTLVNKVAGTDTSDAEFAGIKKAGGYVQFAPGTTQVRMKLSLSYVKTGDLALGQASPTSVHHGGSSLNLATEVPTADYKLNGANAPASYQTAFNTVRSATYARWNAALSKIQVSDSASARDIGTFYHSLYRSYLHPNVIDDVDGNYPGFDDFNYISAGATGTDKDATIHNIATSNAAYGLNQKHVYANLSDWDTYRSWAPLVAMMEPKIASDIAQTYVLNADQWGQFPRWSLANQSTGQMSGDNASALVSQVHAFGADDFATGRALHFMYDGALAENAGKVEPGVNPRKVNRAGSWDYNVRKYAPQTPDFQTDHAVTGASIAQEWSIDDFAISEFAKSIGSAKYPGTVPPDVVEQFEVRSNYWENHFNPLTMCVSARDYAGRYPVGSNCEVTPGDFGYRGTVTGYGQVGFDEAVSEQYLWLAPQNMEGLANALGGKSAAAERLDKFMTGGYNVGANLPQMWAGNEPNFATPWGYNYLGRPWRTQEVVEDIRTQLFGVGRDGAEPGNDDLGAMSAWYVWAALGIYPATPGTNIMTVNAPNFEKAVVDLGSGKKLTINAPGAKTKRYIAGLSVNGAAQSSLAIPDTWQSQNTVLDFAMSPQATTWGTGENDAPASFSYGSNAVVGYGDSISVAPGGSGTLNYAIQRIAATARSYSLDFSGAPAGFSVSATKTMNFDSTGHAVQPLTIKVGTSVADGDYLFPVTTITDGVRSTSEVAVRVAKSQGFLAAANRAAVSYEGARAGHFDGNSSWLREGLETAGLTRGGQIDIGAISGSSALTGLKAILPEVSEGFNDVIVPGGQIVSLAGEPTRVSFLGASKAANTDGTATVRLDDGSTVTTDLSFGDWVVPSNVGTTANGTLQPYKTNIKVVWEPVRIGQNSNPGAYVYATAPYTAPAGRHIVSVTLNGSGSGDNRRILGIAQDKFPAAVALPVQNVSPVTVAAGGTIAVSGSNFAAGESVDVIVAGKSVASLIASAQGLVAGTATLPRLTALGEKSVQLVGKDSGAARTDTITVTAAVWNTSISVASTAVAGSQILVTGAGFGESEPVVLTVVKAGQTISTSHIAASAAGTVDTSVPAPATTGTIQITLTGGTSGQAKTASVSVTPIPTTPGEDAKVSLSVKQPLSIYGQKVTLTAQVAAGVTGQVEFFDGKKSLGKSAISGGSASLTITGFSAGSHAITAQRVGSTPVSTIVAVDVVKSALKSIKVTGSKYKRGKATSVKVSLGALTSAQRATGKVTVYVGKKKAATVNVNGKSSVKVKIAKKFTKSKSIKVRAKFDPSNSANVIGKTSAIATVKAK